MANNIQALKDAVKTAFGANLDATTLGKLRNRFVAAYPAEWAARVAGGVADTAANRNTFAVDKVFDHIQDIYQNQSYRENVAAMPTPETIQ